MVLGVAVWSGFLFSKYHVVTIGTSGPYNHALVGPQSEGVATGHLFYHRLFKPTNPTAVSIWEDPTPLTLPAWSPLDSRESFVHQVKLVAQSAYKSFII